jgi:hypothetical protein
MSWRKVGSAEAAEAFLAECEVPATESQANTADDVGAAGKQASVLRVSVAEWMSLFSMNHGLLSRRSRATVARAIRAFTETGGAVLCATHDAGFVGDVTECLELDRVVEQMNRASMDAAEAWNRLAGEWETRIGPLGDEFRRFVLKPLLADGSQLLT